MAKRNTVNKWVNRHKEKHLCLCGCGESIEIKQHHYYKGIPKFIKGHNFSSEYNPKINEDLKTERKSPSWEMLSEEEKERRLSNLNKFGKMEEHPQWKGGRVLDESGYIRIRKPEHPFASDGYVLEHRLVMEEFLREKYPGSPYLTYLNGELYLKTSCVVHHINEQKDCNDISNLFPFPDAAAHIFWHNSPLSEEEKIEKIKSGSYRTYE